MSVHMTRRREIAWVLSLLLLFGTGALGLSNGVRELANTLTPLQRSVSIGVLVYGVLGAVGGLLLAHLRLDLLEVGGRERSWQVEVVVEAVLDGGTDAELRVGEELEHGRGHHVRRAVPHRGEVVGCVGSDLVPVDGHAVQRSASATPAQSRAATPCARR